MASQGDDCYFFYYSTCTKGSQCPYRHCTEALGTEIVCRNWSKTRNNCRKQNCPFRHMQIDKFRSGESCYWERQPGGCRKPHCVYKHTLPRDQFGTINATPEKTALPPPSLLVWKANEQRNSTNEEFLTSSDSTPSDLNDHDDTDDLTQSPVVVVKKQPAVIINRPQISIGDVHSSVQRKLILPSIDMQEPGTIQSSHSLLVSNNRTVIPSSWDTKEDSRGVPKRPLREGDLRLKLKRKSSGHNSAAEMSAKESRLVMEKEQDEDLKIEPSDRPKRPKQSEDERLSIEDLDEAMVLPKEDDSIEDLLKIKPSVTDKPTRPVKIKRKWSKETPAFTDCSVGDKFEPPADPVHTKEQHQNETSNNEYETLLVEVFGKDLAAQFRSEGIQFDLNDLKSRKSVD